MALHFPPASAPSPCPLTASPLPLLTLALRHCRGLRSSVSPVGTSGCTSRVQKSGGGEICATLVSTGREREDCGHAVSSVSYA
ncbi:hypothetical protein FB45DRAFT_1067854 [Roridomyces roridus]|uniref:Uncharacterized protein n=1 Tax=Roridomyces roridus TaxID=1738132 RepID=A0AAD7B1Z9_9AGAR|nr:hypothetical protein FB45DRAFT_1067854 [Roridomyces roridus]